MLELVHINTLLYLSHYAPSASVPGLALGCLCSSCRSMQGSMNKMYEALAYTWYYPEPAEAILRKKYPLQTPREGQTWVFTDWIIMVSTNKAQFCYASSVSMLEFFVIGDWFSEAVLILCYPLVLILYSFVVVLYSVMKGTAQRGRVQNPYLLFIIKLCFKAFNNFWLLEQQKFSFLLPWHLLLPVPLQK